MMTKPSKPSFRYFCLKEIEKFSYIISSETTVKRLYSSTTKLISLAFIKSSPRTSVGVKEKNYIGNARCFYLNVNVLAAVLAMILSNTFTKVISLQNDTHGAPKYIRNSLFLKGFVKIWASIWPTVNFFLSRRLVCYHRF